MKTKREKERKRDGEMERQKERKRERGKEERRNDAQFSNDYEGQCFKTKIGEECKIAMK